MELRDKVDPFATGLPAGSAGAASSGSNAEEALSALVMLGFPKTAAEKVLDKVCGTNPGASVEDLIKLTLAHGI